MARDLDSIAPKKRLVNPNARHKPESPVELYVDGLMKDVMRHSIDVPPRHEWRVSSFPICGFLHLIKQMEHKPKPQPYSMDFFTSVGTAVHETIQHHKANHPLHRANAVGRFSCKPCGWEQKEIGHRPIACPNCQNQILEYIEIDFKIAGIGGHLDFLEETDKYRIACEYKTTSGQNIEDPSRYLPYPKHFFQIETYCFMLGHLYNLLPTHYAIIYLNRDASFSDSPVASRKPYYSFVYKVTPDMMDHRRRQLQRTAKARVAVEKFLAQPNKQALLELATHRPCRTREDYRLHMKPTFFGDEECPYHKDGSCFSTKAGDVPKPVRDIWSMVQNPLMFQQFVSNLAIPASYDEVDT